MGWFCFNPLGFVDILTLWDFSYVDILPWSSAWSSARSSLKY